MFKISLLLRKKQVAIILLVLFKSKTKIKPNNQSYVLRCLLKLKKGVHEEKPKNERTQYNWLL